MAEEAAAQLRPFMLTQSMAGLNVHPAQLLVQEAAVQLGLRGQGLVLSDTAIQPNPTNGRLEKTPCTPARSRNSCPARVRRAGPGAQPHGRKPARAASKPALICMKA